MRKWSHGERRNSHVPLEECWHTILIQREAAAWIALNTHSTDVARGRAEPVCMFTSAHAVVRSGDKRLHRSVKVELHPSLETFCLV